MAHFLMVLRQSRDANRANEKDVKSNGIGLSWAKAVAISPSTLVNLKP